MEVSEGVGLYPFVSIASCVCPRTCIILDMLSGLNHTFLGTRLYRHNSIVAQPQRFDSNADGEPSPTSVNCFGILRARDIAWID